MLRILGDQIRDGFLERGLLGQLEAENGIPGGEKHTQGHGQARERSWWAWYFRLRKLPFPSIFHGLWPEARYGHSWHKVSSTQASLHRRWALRLPEKRGSDGGTELKLGEGACTASIVTSSSMHLSVLVYIWMYVWECV